MYLFLFLVGELHANPNYCSGPPSADQMAAMAKQRQAKIERFKRQKETEQHLQELYKQVQKEHVDEDVKV